MCICEVTLASASRTGANTLTVGYKRPKYELTIAALYLHKNPHDDLAEGRRHDSFMGRWE